MSDQKFKLKRGALITDGFGSSVHYTSANITDDKAIELLTNHPGLITEFEDYPKNEDGTVDLGKVAKAPKAKASKSKAKKAAGADEDNTDEAGAGEDSDEDDTNNDTPTE